MSELERLVGANINMDAIVVGAMEILPFELFESLKYGMIPLKPFQHLTKMIKEKIVTIGLEGIGEIVNPESIEAGIRCLKPEIVKLIEKELSVSFLKNTKHMIG